VPSLLLHPDYRQWRPADLDGFAMGLAELGFLGTRPEPGDSQVYPAGDRFLQLVTFLGCSPQVALRPVDARPGQEICCIHFRDFAADVFLASDPLPKARCPNCRAPLTISKPNAVELPVKCESCASLLQRDWIDWRRGGGYGRFFIEVKGIFPHEAVPSEQLLKKLSAYSDCPWAFFYIDTQSCAS
jgi:hypothetical protein